MGKCSTSDKNHFKLDLVSYNLGARLNTLSVRYINDYRCADKIQKKANFIKISVFRFIFVAFNFYLFKLYFNWNCYLYCLSLSKVRIEEIISAVRFCFLVYLVYEIQSVAGSFLPSLTSNIKELLIFIDREAICSCLFTVQILSEIFQRIKQICLMYFSQFTTSELSFYALFLLGFTLISKYIKNE